MASSSVPDPERLGRGQAERHLRKVGREGRLNTLNPKGRFALACACACTCAHLRRLQQTSHGPDEHDPNGTEVYLENFELLVVGALDKVIPQLVGVVGGSGEKRHSGLGCR